jgi:hypothetical protein
MGMGLADQIKSQLAKNKLMSRKPTSAIKEKEVEGSG